MDSLLLSDVSGRLLTVQREKVSAVEACAENQKNKNNASLAPTQVEGRQHRVSCFGRVAQRGKQQKVEDMQCPRPCGWLCVYQNAWAKLSLQVRPFFFPSKTVRSPGERDPIAGNLTKNLTHL